MIEVRALLGEDREWKREMLTRAWGSSEVARRGEVVDALTLEGFVAIEDGIPVGLLTYAIDESGVEVVTINVEREGCGAGQVLMDAVRAKALEMRVRRLWLSTTNNNLRAQRFYRRWGMGLALVIDDGVAASRAVKPSIPTVDEHGVPIRDELVFELIVRPLERRHHRERADEREEQSDHLPR